VLQNEKQTSGGHQLTSGSRPHRAQANQLQPNEYHQNITEKRHTNYRSLIHKLKHQNNPFR